jgi:hypothetical protein
MLHFVEGKSKVSLVRHYAVKTYRGVKIYPTLSYPWHQMEVCDQLHALAAISVRKQPPFTRWT